MAEVLQDFRIRYQRGDAFRSYVSINDRVDQCWSEVIPPLVTLPFLARTAQRAVSLAMLE